MSTVVLFFRICKENVIFGSISGYIGFYNIPRSDLKYIQEIFDEIIRGVKSNRKFRFILMGTKPIALLAILED